MSTDSGMSRRLRQGWVMALLGMVLVLLMAVMAATPAIACFTRLPTAATALPVGRGAIKVGIDRTGRYWLGDSDDPGPIRADRLAARLEAAFMANAGERVLHLEADREGEYAVVLTLLDVARELGVLRVELIAECPPGGESLLRRCGQHPRP